MIVSLIAMLLAVAAPPPIVLDGPPPRPKTGGPAPIVLDGSTPAADTKRSVGPAFDPIAPLAASTPWSSFDEGYRCTIERNFGPRPASAGIKLSRSAIPGGTDGNFLIIRGSVRYRFDRQLAIDFHDGAAPIGALTSVIQAPKVDVTMFRFHVPQTEFWTRWAKARTITFRYGGDPVATIAVTSPQQVAETAAACARRQLAAVGGTPQEAASYLGEGEPLDKRGWTLPSSKVQNFFHSEDYPSAARDKGIGGQTLIAYRVGTDGRASGCTVVKSSRNRELDDASCAILTRRVIFTPARDPAGQPAVMVKSTWINWAMPSDADYLGSGFASGFTGAGQGGGTVN